MNFDIFRIIPTCCTSYIYDDTLQLCIACIGRFGDDCSQSCPLGYYGRQCNATCDCDNTVCDKVTGCLQVTSDKTSLYENETSTEKTELYENVTSRELDICKRKDSELIVRHALTTLVIFIFLLVGVIIAITYRLGKKTKTKNQGVNIQGSLTIDCNTCDSPPVYIDVIQPRTSPVRVMEQVDQLVYSEIK